MSDVIGGRQWRRVALSLVLGSIVIGMGAIPALAATTPFTATYPDERTTFHPCPPGFPPHAVCFTGVGHGATVVGTMTLNGTEDYAGFVDPNTPGSPIPACPADHNAVSITTTRGTLFLTTSGSACGAFDDGTWQALGGTGIFEGATGGGTVHTTVDPVANTDGSLNSSSTYLGTTFSLHSD
jgi:hypothetical protein